ncbi:unnamed protein product [Callosobruchus maculatus]|uniref:C2H2-type domain-containing protein n=1 Tax=Callosobruchus maculatus TaxID=64391 RepID=A0A653CZE1_CALMS|nr:unnamed protein product [Callosobruchus maculatus]
MIRHPEISGNRILTRCIYCNKTFKGKSGLDDHIVKRHPDFIASVSRKIHECTQCTYKTTYGRCIREHLMIKHPEISVIVFLVDVSTVIRRLKVNKDWMIT